MIDIDLNNKIEERIKQYKLNWTLDKVSSVKQTDVLIYKLVEQMANDSNSSSLREDVTKWMIGKEASISKHGYDDDFEAIEVKPKNYTGKGKLNGGGSFNDFTWRRDETYHNDNVIVVTSGFVFGKLVFVTQFSYDVLRPKIQQALDKQLPDGDVTNRYVRSASFSYLNWRDSDFTVSYKSDKFESFKPFMVKGLYETLS